ncbi:unnamed protein product (macronuclear) [Paramecium tetraurelia]|uniref:Cyclic nucleotide-binding domain-containing protein n=1 Tax=Paramecium tetraurelia TaxID=5888 RepID=A0CXP6_PARTE|nr:uncharacterized protein GSPATT00011195001 [Paramecium tetraurelia]CAK75563.1 unnamed protein product [Paramecium tetraurelia]|eukprot:XP_001442960.1 hypothetical protein (macronuclear) [Paramecium tetraurelia strain d4-2]
MIIGESDLYQLIQSINKRSMFKTKFDLEFIDVCLKDVPFFHDLRKQVGETQYQQILRELQYECHIPYEPQVNIGDMSTKFYFILSGKFLVLTRSYITYQDIVMNAELQEMHITIWQTKSADSEILGFDSLRLPVPRVAFWRISDDVRSVSYSNNIALGEVSSHSDKEGCLQKNQRYLVIQIVDIQSRKQDAEKFALLSTVPMFSKWSAKTLRQLLCDISEINFIPNQLIYQQGDPVDAVYIIVDGEVQLFRQYNKNIHPISILGCKECFGDDEILSQFRSHSAKSINCVRLYKIFRNKFLDHIPIHCEGNSLSNHQSFATQSSILNRPFLSSNQTLNKFSLYQAQNEELRIYRSESLKSFNSPAKVWQKVMNKKKEKSRTYQTISSTQQVHDLLRRNYRHSDESLQAQKVYNSQSPKVKFANTPTCIDELTNEGKYRIHANGKYDKTNYLMGQIKLRSITQSVWKKQLDKIK